MLYSIFGPLNSHQQYCKCKDIMKKSPEEQKMIAEEIWENGIFFHLMIKNYIKIIYIYFCFLKFRNYITIKLYRNL